MRRNESAIQLCLSLFDAPIWRNSIPAVAGWNVAGRDLAVFNVSGDIYCLDNTCLHRGGPLGDGFLEGDIVTCPWHGWQYNVRTGELLIDPSVKIATYPVRVEGDEIKIAVNE